MIKKPSPCRLAAGCDSITLIRSGDDTGVDFTCGGTGEILIDVVWRRVGAQSLP